MALFEQHKAAHRANTLPWGYRGNSSYPWPTILNPSGAAAVLLVCYACHLRRARRRFSHPSTGPAPSSPFVTSEPNLCCRYLEGGSEKETFAARVTTRERGILAGPGKAKCQTGGPARGAFPNTTSILEQHRIMLVISTKWILLLFQIKTVGARCLFSVKNLNIFSLINLWILTNIWPLFSVFMIPKIHCSLIVTN